MINLSGKKKPKVFISYKHDCEPDDSLAKQLFDKLSELFTVFRDRESLQIGDKWPEKIKKEIKKSDFFITLLSAESVVSEMVQVEIEQAFEHQSEKDKPIILPIRLSFNEPFTKPLSLYLNDIQWFTWEKIGDTEKLIAALVEVIQGKSKNTAHKSEASPQQQLSNHQTTDPQKALPSAQISLESPEGTLDPNSSYYVERDSDTRAIKAIKDSERQIISIKGSRQVGKSSLLQQIMHEARLFEKDVVFMDFQQIDKTTLKDPSIFYPRFCTWISHELKLPNKVEETWRTNLPDTKLCTDYMQRHVLSKLDKPLLLAMDEVEKMLQAPFSSDFFGMLRSWYNNRISSGRLDIALVTSTEPYLLIESHTQSPFNVGTTIEISDFNRKQVEWLRCQYNPPFTSYLVEVLYEYLNGHPYLTRKAMYDVATGRIGEEELIETIADERGPFEDHLRHYFFSIYGKKKLIDGLIQVLEDNKCTDLNIFWRLRGAGLVRSKGKQHVPRCKLYEEYFKAKFNVR